MLVDRMVVYWFEYIFHLGLCMTADLPTRVQYCMK